MHNLFQNVNVTVLGKAHFSSTDTHVQSKMYDIE